MMKKVFLQIVVIFLVCAVFACKNTPSFTEVSGKEWKLVEVHINDKSIGFDRSLLGNEGFGEIFTLNFDAERISGTGAPNRYTAPYTVNKDMTLNVSMIAGTLMAPIRQPEKLKESDYFKYIQNAVKWDLVKGNLQILSKTDSGSNVTLVFSLEAVKK